MFKRARIKCLKDLDKKKGEMRKRKRKKKKIFKSDELRFIVQFRLKVSAKRAPHVNLGGEARIIRG